jgi:predicted  nucleic acid-binding Zn-ribbon protein
VALVTCKDCGTRVSSEAAACPKCGRPIGGNVTSKKKTSTVTWIVALVIAGVGFSSLESRCEQERAATAAAEAADPEQKRQAALTPEQRSAEHEAARKAAQTKADEATADYLRKVEVTQAGLEDLNVRAVDSVDAATLVANVFSAGSDLVRQSNKMTLDPVAVMKVQKLALSLSKKQVEALPEVRRRMGKVFSGALWKVDATALTYGDRFTTVEFIAGEFAAHARIEEAHKTILPPLEKLRFKRATYK